MSPLIIKLIATAVLLAVGGFASLVMLNRLENPVTEFANYEEMINSDLMRSGWIPKVLPKSAYAITETHNLDTNLVQIEFKYTPGDTAVAKQKCQQTNTTDTLLIFSCSKGRLTLTRDGIGKYSEPGNNRTHNPY